jgi:hypothetical protein
MAAKGGGPIRGSRLAAVAAAAFTLLVFLAIPPLRAADPVPVPASSGDTRVAALLDHVVQETLKASATASQPPTPDQIALTLTDLQDPAAPTASYRGDVPVYPASVVKLFYLVAAHQWMEDGRLARTDELDRALRRMIVDSWNEAAHYVVDVLTGTTSGPELPRAELDAWYGKRNAVNRYFASLGYRQVVANRKPWCEGPFGRERQSAEVHAPHRNLLTTAETARLLGDVVRHRVVTPARCDAMLGLLARDPVPRPNDPESQVRGFVGEALPAGSRLWSKAGWTSETRHDAACVELPGGRRFILVIFTTGHATDESLLPSITRRVIALLPASHPVPP